MRFVLGLMIILGYASAARKKELEDNCELCDYVYNDDGYLNYTVTRNPFRDALETGISTYLLKVTSQKWMDEKYNAAPLWTHSVYLTFPNDTSKIDSSTVTMSLVGQVKKLQMDLFGFLKTMAREVHAVTVLVLGVPNEPIYFIDNFGKRTKPFNSFQSLAYSAGRFQNQTHANITLIAAMVKVAVKVMDVVEDFMKQRDVTVDKFILHGASKRGYAVWLSAAIDDRVAAIIPVCANFLNFEEMIYHVYKSLGGHFPIYSKTMRMMSKFRFLGNNATKKYAEITDPYAYREYITVPKYLILASQDDLYPADNLALFYKDLKGETKLFVEENARHTQNFHDVKDFGKAEMSAINSFIKSIYLNIKRPTISWQESQYRSCGVLHSKFKVTSSRPADVVEMFVADSPSYRRDFRRIVGCWECPKIKLCDTCRRVRLNDKGDQWVNDTSTKITKETKDNHWFYTVDYIEPTLGKYRAFYMKLQYLIRSERFFFTTEVMVLPNTYPINEICQGDACASVTLV